MLREYTERVQNTRPLVHCITNYVTVNDVANVVLACGGRPVMADDVQEAPEITEICHATYINTGTLNPARLQAMLAAGRRANELGHVTVLDPVGVGASRTRTASVQQLLKQVHFTAIRGNISEIRTLMRGFGTTQGVEADDADALAPDDLSAVAEQLKGYAAKLDSILVVSGDVDLVCDGERCIAIHNGRPEMSRITGTGCQLSGVIAAYLGACEDDSLARLTCQGTSREEEDMISAPSGCPDPLIAAAAAVCHYGYAGEAAWSRMRAGEGNATYRNRIIDAVYCMFGEELETGARWEVIG